MAQGTQPRVWRRVGRLGIIGLMRAIMRGMVEKRLRYRELTV